MENKVVTLNRISRLTKQTENFIKHIENNLHSSTFKTIQNVRRYKGEDMPIFFNEFTSIICYVASLNKAVVMEDYSHIPPSIEKDLKLAQTKGELSIYLSIVTNALIRDLYPNIQCNLVQGFYTYTNKEQTTYSTNTTSFGFHAFSVIGEKVIDCNFFSTNPEYKSPAPAIIGLVPDDVEFYGWEEGVSVDQHYIEEYALTNHDSVLDWLVTHLDMQRDYLIASIL